MHNYEHENPKANLWIKSDILIDIYHKFPIKIPLQM